MKDAIARGISSRRKIAEVTGLQRATVDLILDRMEATGALKRESIGGMCPGGGCSNCGMSASGSGTCASSGAGSSNGPVALVLTRRP
nr:FeoC-like transcriptional regulator [Corynebacterium lactis]